MSINNDVTIGINVQDKGATATLKKIESGIKDSGKVIDRSSLSTIHSMRSILASVTYLQTAANIAFTTLSRSFGMLINNTERLKMSVAANASLMVTFGEPTKDLGKAYSEAYTYANKLQEKLVEINGRTVANLYQMDLVNREFLKQGVILDVNNKKQVEGFAVITNAIGILTAGMPNPDIQYGQELRSVLEGVARQGTTLALVLKSKLGPAWSDIVDRWKADGTLIENLAEQLKGFEAGANSLASTWTVVSSTVASWLQFLLGRGFEPLYSFIIDKVKEIDTLLETNRENIINYLTSISSTIKAMLETVSWERIVTILKDIAIVFGIIIGLKLALNIAAIVVALQNLRTACIGASLGVGLLGAALRTAGFVGLALLIGTVGKAVWDISAAWSKAKDNADLYKATQGGSYDDQTSAAKSVISGKGTAQDYASLGIKYGTTNLIQTSRSLEDARNAAIGEDLGAFEYKGTQYFTSKSNREAIKAMANRPINQDVAKPPSVSKSPPDEDRLDILIMKVQESGLHSLSTQELIEYRKLMKAKKRLTSSVKEAIDYELASRVSMPINYGKMAPTGLDIATPGEDSDSAVDLNIEEQKEAWLAYYGFIGNITLRITESVESGFTDMFESLLKGTSTLQDAFQKLGQNIVDTMVRTFAEIAASFATSGILDMLSYIPGLQFLKPISIAMQATRKAKYGFADGTDYIPQDMRATVHQGEQIIPKTYNEAISSGKITIGKTGETNSLLSTMITKLDSIRELAMEKGHIVLGDSELKVFSKALDVAGFKRMEYGY